MERKIDEETNTKTEIIENFKKLSEDGKKSVVKTLLWDEIFSEYIKYKLVGVRHPDGEIYSDKELKKYKEELVNSATNAVNELAETLYGDDTELLIRITQKFIESYNGVVSITKEEMCGNNHAFTEWEKQMVERPHYTLDDDESEICYKLRYIRTCEKCGVTQIAYSKRQKEGYEEYTSYMKKYGESNQNIGKKLNKKISL